MVLLSITWCLILIMESGGIKRDQGWAFLRSRELIDISVQKHWGNSILHDIETFSPSILFPVKPVPATSESKAWIQGNYQTID